MSMTPTTRLEKWLAKIAGESVDIQPKDRLETLLAKIAGESVSITPDDSLEYWLNQIAENGGGGGSSDFSTAEVTINVTVPEGVTIYETELFTNIYNNDGSIFYQGQNLVINGVATAVLYKGSCSIASSGVVAAELGTGTQYILPSSDHVTLSGNIVWDGEAGAYLVTGNCSITATLESGGK